ncbi:hypothetical protein N7492_008519 [Penicillium capsulatum]|uniref:Uncharacterized protein n=1 Tax=Penicillium capsulatum TaxID=69766 RepID=A0A9W9HQV4_9EURO|nr:hypothetical protein N7492_008519 [Penicillium capsulatum]KAJ6105922.1 hypothetical protein N7512_009439 [Penicillium capsulatum]
MNFYLSKHPGGVGRLQNVIQIDGKNVIFGPGAHRVVLSATELEERSIEAYNRPQDLADEEKILLYTTFPHFVHPDFAPKTWGALAEEAKYYADDTLGEVEWKDSQADREKEADGLHLMFNFQRLITCLEGSKEAHVNGAMDEDVLSRAMKLKYLQYSEDLERGRALTRGSISASLSTPKKE